jgi:hypothetical protein
MLDLGASKFNEGFIEGWLEDEAKQKRPGADRILEAWRLYASSFDELRVENHVLRDRLDSIQKVLAI